MTLSMTKIALHGKQATVSVVLIILLLIMVVLMCSIPWIQWFRRELKYINSEINRNEGREKERWKRRKKRLLLSIIPFVPYE